MNGTPPQTRRQVLRTGLAGATLCLAGCTTSALVSSESVSDSTASSSDAPPVVDNSASDSDQTVRIAVTVLDDEGEPAQSVGVALEDRGGTPDDRYGETGPGGELHFVESVGPPPCNWLTLRIPDSGITDRLGCVNGNTTIRRTYQLGESESTPAVDYPVVDNAGSTPKRTITVDLTVLHESGKPVSGAAVVLEDRGGTPDDRSGETGPKGRIRFLEGVGPPPCNRQTVRLPEFETSLSLGCNNGGKTIEKTILLDE